MQVSRDEMQVIAAPAAGTVALYGNSQYGKA